MVSGQGSIGLGQDHREAGQVFPHPADGDAIGETLPCFTWLKVAGATSYRLTVHQGARCVLDVETPRTYYIPTEPLQPGAYTWDLAVGSEHRGIYHFTVRDDAVTVPRPSVDDVLAGLPHERPFLLFTRAERDTILRTRRLQLDTLRRNVALARQHELILPPRFHVDPEALPYREYFGAYRDHVDRDLMACALAYGLLDDREAGDMAHRRFVALCRRGADGPCSIQSSDGDEIGLSNARCFPSVYDLLYDLLTPDERDLAAEVLDRYGTQCEARIGGADYAQYPGDSHAGRLPAYLGEIALTLADRTPPEVTRRRLDLALSLFNGIYPHYGTEDGGWAEGLFYASSYTKWYLPFLNAVRRFSGHDLLQRPFYQHVSRYFMHFAVPGMEIHPFGDGYWCQPEDPEWPGFMAQNPYGLYARRFGPALARRWEHEASAPERFLLHVADAFLPVPEEESAPEGGEDAGGPGDFAQAGFAAMHSDLAHPSRNTSVYCRASKFGSLSHRHADQGNFAILYGGKGLISPSGYFGRGFGTRHHRDWTRQTRAHNVILVDGRGQPASSAEACGKILRCTRLDDRDVTALDLCAAYPMLTRFERTLTLMHDGRRVVVTDHIDAPEPVVIDWLLHTLSPPARIDGTDDLQLTRGARLIIRPDPAHLTLAEILDHFPVPLNEGVPAPYQVSMPPQYHIRYRTARGRHHRITCVFDIVPPDDLPPIDDLTTTLDKEAHR